MDIAIEPASAATAEIVTLLGELDAALSGPYSPDQRHALSIEQLFQPEVRFFVARVDGMAVACGGVAFLDGYAEVKRMYTRPSVRGRGVGTKGGTTLMSSLASLEDRPAAVAR